MKHIQIINKNTIKLNSILYTRIHRSLLYNKYYTYNNMNYSNNTHLI